MRQFIGSGRRHLKNLFWSLYGARLKNPSLPTAPRVVVFLCLGNICRSAYGDQFVKLKRAAKLSELKLEVESAGLRVKNSVSPDQALKTARERGIDLTGNVPTQIDEQIMQRADMVLAMEPGQLVELKRRFPHHAGKGFLLPLFENRVEASYDGWLRYHIEDPYGKESRVFHASFERIERCVDGLITALHKRRQDD